MKHLSKIPLYFFVTFMLTGCQKSSLPSQTHPLKAGVVENALEETELSWRIVDEQSWAEGHVVYSLSDQNDRMIAMVTSIGEGDAQNLGITFLPKRESSTLTTSLPEADIQKAFILAALLYGDFESENSVYDAFQENFQTKSEIRKQSPPKGEPRFMRESRIGMVKLKAFSVLFPRGNRI